MPMIEIKPKDAPSKSRWNRNRCYKAYVLFLLVLAYLFSQMDRYMLSVTILTMAQDIQFGDRGCLKNASVPGSSSRMCSAHTRESCLQITSSDNHTLCKWDYNGHGWSYLILVGPMFILVYTFSGILLGLVADRLNRKRILAMCIVFWSLMTFLTGLVTEYWQLVVLRFCLGLGESGCTPFASSLISDYFSRSNRGTAMGIYHFGIYFGYSLSYAVGNGITLANINGQGWRWAFFLLGIPGAALGLLVALTIKEPERFRTDNKPPANEGEELEESSSDGLLSFSSSYELSDESVREPWPPTTENLAVLLRAGSSTDMIHSRHHLGSSHTSLPERLYRVQSRGSHTDLVRKHTLSGKVFKYSHVRLSAEGSATDPIHEKVPQQQEIPLQRTPDPRIPAIKKKRGRCVLLLKAFLMPAFALLCLAGSIRNAAGYTLAYYTQLYFEASHVSMEEIAMYMSWIPLLGGSVGALGGGFLSDRVVKKKKLHARVFVIVVSQFLATPFAICVLSLEAPFAFYSFLPALLFGEMWISVALTVAVELVPGEIRTSVVALYLFVITNIGGNFPLIVPSITYAFEFFGYNHLDSIRGSLFIMYPGFFFLSGLIFLLTMFVIKWKERARALSPATDEVMKTG